MLKHVLTVSAATLFATGAVAQTMNNEITEISAWNYDELYALDGIRGENLLDADVYGENGEEIGEVENVVMNDQRAVALLVESGGFLDIGDRHIVVPWEMVEFVDGTIVIPAVEERLEEFDVWGEGSVVSTSLDEIKLADDGDVATTPTMYRLSDVLDDYATAGGVGYGYIDDVIISRDGSVEAVVTMARNGYYATPYYGPGYGYAPYSGTYDIGYGESELGELEEFEYGEIEDDGWF